MRSLLMGAIAAGGLLAAVPDAASADTRTLIAPLSPACSTLEAWFQYYEGRARESVLLASGLCITIPKGEKVEVLEEHDQDELWAKIRWHSGARPLVLYTNPFYLPLKKR